jgi:uncharacterized membrane protein YphA (DoxX/SURF4 family)
VPSDWLFIHGYEKPCRPFVAAMEIVASVLVLVPYTRMRGAALASGVMSGAIFFHVVSPSSINWYYDGGALFKQACPVWLCATFILLFHGAEVRVTIAGFAVRFSLART